MCNKRRAGMVISAFMMLAGVFWAEKYAATAYEMTLAGNIANTEYEAGSGNVLDDWDYSETDDSVILKRYIGTSTDIIIPGMIDGKQVFLQDTGRDTGTDRFPENTTSIIIGSAEQKVKVTNGNAARLFSGLTELTHLDAKGLDTSDITTMYRMFFMCGKLAGLDLSGWDTGRVTDMDYMFQSCNSLAQLDVSGWDTGNVTSMYSMFRGCSSLTGLDVSGWDTGQVADMSCMFYSCTSLAKLDLSGWDTGSMAGSNMEAMFYDCSGLKELNVSGWNTGNITSLQNMFFNCGSLERLDLSSWDVSNVVSLNYMFHYCGSLEELNLNSWDTGSVQSILYTFYNCGALQIMDLSGQDYSNVMQGLSAGVFDLEDASAALPTLIVSDDPLIQNICEGTVAGRVPAGPTYHFEEGTFLDESGNFRSAVKYFDTLWTADIADFTVDSIANKYIPEKEGAVFAGWYLDETHFQPFEEAGYAMSLRDLIRADLYAKFLDEYRVTFVDYDGSVIKEMTVLEGGAAVAPEENPSREGYTFIGWDKDFDNVTEDLVIKALYEEKKELQENTDEENDGQGNVSQGKEETDALDRTETPAENGAKENDTEKTGTEESGAAENAEGNETGSTTAQEPSAPGTGDAAAVGFFVFLFGFSLISLVVLIVKKADQS